MAGVAHLLLPTDRARQWLGKKGLAGVGRASLLGLPLPLCSCSVIPVAAALRKQGAGKGATTSFLISTPQTGIDSIAVTYALLDPVITIFRPVASLISAMVAGLLVDAIDPDKHAHTDGSSHAGPACPHCQGQHQDDDHTPNSGSWPVRMFRFGFVEVARDTLWPLVIGLILSGAMAAAIPEDFFTRYLGNEALAIVLMLAVGLPFYVCASASTPIAAVMILKGLSPGAALVFLLAGPATNITTMLIVRQQLGWRSLWAYLASVAASAVAAGLLLNLISRALFEGKWHMALSSTSRQMLPPWIMHVCAALLGVVLLAAAVAKIQPLLRRKPRSCGAGP